MGTRKKAGLEWRPISFDECEVCGGEAEALTRCDTPDGHFMGEDEVRCRECRMPGMIVVDEWDERAQVCWHDCGDKEEACVWCQMRDAFENTRA